MEGIDVLIVELSDLTDLQRKILIKRYCKVVVLYQLRVWRINLYFNLMRFIVTVGSLIVPALLSIQTPGSKNDWINHEGIYWSTWTISLAVTMSNGILTLFKIDKKYYSLNTILQHLRSEGWQYLELTGRYSGHYGNHVTKPTHKNQFVYFSNMIEKIVMRQVEDEFYKVTESLGNNPTPQQNGVGKIIANSLLPPSPSDLASMPSPVILPAILGDYANQPVMKQRSHSITREGCNVELELPIESSAWVQQSQEHYSAVNIKVDTNSVPPQEMNPNSNPKSGQKMPLSVDLITVIPMQ
jgi:hypothetical protein